MELSPDVQGVKQQVVVFEVVIRYLPQTGQIQVGSSQIDDVTKMGMLEMAKVALINQANQPQSPLVVSGRFA